MQSSRFADFIFSLPRGGVLLTLLVVYALVVALGVTLDWHIGPGFALGITLPCLGGFVYGLYRVMKYPQGAKHRYDFYLYLSAIFGAVMMAALNLV